MWLKAAEICDAMLKVLWRIVETYIRSPPIAGLSFVDTSKFPRLSRPMCIWLHLCFMGQRLNENCNGLLRQCIKDIRTITDKQLAGIEREINLRPRKCFGFKQPAVVFEEMSRAAQGTSAGLRS